jgi:hypothetical protein
MFALTGERCVGGKGPLAGRNYDWATADLRWCELRRIIAPQEPCRIGYSHHWAGCTDVLSEQGLYIAIASLPRQPVCAPGVQWHIIVDMIVRECTTVPEAVEACARVRHLRPMSSLLVGAVGKPAVVEATPQEVRVRWPQNGVVVAANAHQGGKTLRQWPPEGELQGHSVAEASEYRGDALERARARIRRVWDLLGTGHEPVGEAQAAEVLRDHRAPLCTGEHDHPDGGRWATIWSGTCRPAAGAFRIAPGLPCRHAYQDFRL